MDEYATTPLAGRTTEAVIHASRAAELVAEDRSPQVTEACDQIAKENARLRELVGVLEDRLGPVLNPHVLATASPQDGAIPQLERAPLADRLRSSARETAESSDRLETLLLRIEV